MATARAIEAARAFVRITADDSKLRKTLMGVKSSLTGLASSALVAGKAISGAMLATGIGALVSGVGAAAASVKQFAAMAGGLDDAAKRTGASAEALSQLRYAAEQNGASLDDVEKAIRRVGDVMSDAEKGSKTAVDAFAKVGLSLADLEGLTVDQRLVKIMGALSKIEDPSRRSALAMDLLGRSGANLAKLTGTGAAGINALMQEADALGMTVSTEQAERAAAFGDTWNRLVATLQGVGKVIGSAVMPYLTAMMQAVISAVPAVIKIGQTLGSAFMAGAQQAIAAISSAMEVFQPLLDRALETFGGIRDALVGGDLKLAARIMWLQLKEAWLTGTDAINREWQIWKQGFLQTFSDAVTAVRRMWNQTQNWLSSGIVELMGMIDKSIDVEAVKAELTLMTQEQDRRITQDAERDRAARETAFETSIGKVNEDLQRARDEYAAAVAEARNKAEQVANEPTAAAVADDKFTQLIETLQAGDIASRMTGSIEQSSQNLRTVSGASVLTRLMNSQQQLDQRQVQLLQQQRELTRRLVTITEKGLVAWEV
jgi:hypothetical protein